MSSWLVFLRTIAGSFGATAGDEALAAILERSAAGDVDARQGSAEARSRHALVVLKILPCVRLAGA